MVFGVAIGTLIGAIILRAACSFYNKLAGGAGSPSAVPEPTFSKAAGISFVTMLVNFGIGMVLALARIIHGPGVLLAHCPIPSANRKRGQLVARPSLAVSEVARSLRSMQRPWTAAEQR